MWNAKKYYAREEEEEEDDDAIINYFFVVVLLLLLLLGFNTTSDLPKEATGHSGEDDDNGENAKGSNERIN